MEKFSLADIKRIIEEQKYKFVSLLDREGETVVPYNRPQDKKETALKRFAVIQQRYKALPEGLYQVACRTAFSARIKPDTYALIKGNPRLSDPAPASAPAPVVNLDPNKVLTYTEALALQKDAMEWKAKHDSVKMQYDALKAEYDSLPEENETLEEKPGSNLFEWLDKTSPTFLPILDRYMGLQERKQNLNEFRAINRLDRGGNPRTSARNRPSKNGRVIPELGTEEWEAYLDKLAEAEDQIFQNEMLYLNSHYPDRYAVAYGELVEGEEEEEEEEGEEAKPGKQK